MAAFGGKRSDYNSYGNVGGGGGNANGWEQLTHLSNYNNTACMGTGNNVSNNNMNMNMNPMPPLSGASGANYNVVNVDGSQNKINFDNLNVGFPPASAMSGMPNSSMGMGMDASAFNQLHQHQHPLQ